MCRLLTSRTKAVASLNGADHQADAEDEAENEAEMARMQREMQDLLSG